MIRSLRRRELLGAFGGVGATLLAGCGQPDRGPWRVLSFEEIQFTETADGSTVTFKLIKEHQGADEFSTFHDVRVHGFDSNQTEVCVHEIGTISETYYGGHGLPIEMQCSAVPTMLTYSATESPCDDEILTELAVATYDDEDGWLVTTYRECDEGMPPEPEADDIAPSLPIDGKETPSTDD